MNSSFKKYLNRSLNEKIGITLHLNSGHNLSIVVTELSESLVTGKNRDYDDIAILVTAIIAVSMN